MEILYADSCDFQPTLCVLMALHVFEIQLIGRARVPDIFQIGHDNRQP
jgi:hypothetical protein